MGAVVCILPAITGSLAGQLSEPDKSAVDERNATGTSRAPHASLRCPAASSTRQPNSLLTTHYTSPSPIDRFTPPSGPLLHARCLVSAAGLAFLKFQ